MIKISKVSTIILPNFCAQLVNAVALKVNGTLNAEECSVVKVSGNLTYGGSAKLKINGTYTVSSTGTVSGSGTMEINLSSKSQYNSDISKINDYLNAKNYSKACQLLENAIGAYPDKADSLCTAYSSAVIDWADKLADDKEFLKACSILNSSKKYLTDISDVENRYEFYQGYIPVPLHNLRNYSQLSNLYFGRSGEDTFGNTYQNYYYTIGLAVGVPQYSIV